MAQNKIIEFDPVTNNHILAASDTIEQYGPLADLKISDLK